MIDNKEHLRLIEQQRKVWTLIDKHKERWEELKKWLEISKDAAYARRDPWTVYIHVRNKMEELEEK